MIVIPAVDIKDGLCVRLKQGEMSKATIYSENPAEMAVSWYEQGAERIHLVDLNGAIDGKPVNKDAIKEIVKAVPVPLELGGGIRNIETIEAYLDLGIHQVILGTVAYRDPDFVRLACKKYPEKIILGIDAKQGCVAIEGWTESTDLDPIEMAKSFESDGLAAVIYTDILRDGMSTGPNIKATETLAKAVNIPVIASGGISDIKDIEALLPLSQHGIMGAITGRALYEGTLNLSEAVNLTKLKK